jgi:hypothetical protein
LQDAQEESYITLDLSRVREELHKEFEKNYGPYPESQISAMLLESVMNMFPQLHRVDTRQEGIDYEMAAAFGVPDLTKWLDGYVQKVLHAFNVPTFSQNIIPGVKYDFNFVSTTCCLVIREHKEAVVEIDSDAELAKQLMRGDYLPEADRVRAEKYMLENL